MKVLITGHAGFIGNYFTKKLLAEGHTVTGVDIKLPKHIENIGNFLSIQQDCRLFFKREFYDTFDLVIHCAAVIGGREGIENKSLFLATENLTIDAAFFDWVAKNKPKKVIYWSSSAAYPIELQRKTEQFQIKLEETDLDPIRSSLGNPDETYGLTKVVGEVLCSRINPNNTKVYVFRPFSGYGEEQSFDYPFNSIVNRAIKKEDPLVVWGTGEQVRDFIHIDDIYEATMTVLNMEDGEKLCPLNLGTGFPTSFKELAVMAAELVGYTPEIQPLTDKPMGVEFRCADTTELHKVYKPKVTLREGIERAIKNAV